MIRVEGITTDDDVDDPIVWEFYAQRVEANGLKIRHVIMRESDRVRMTEAYGSEWLEQHKVEVANDLRAWEMGCMGRVQ